MHYDVTAEAWLAGEDAGQLKVDASADLNFRLFNDTVTLAARMFFIALTQHFIIDIIIQNIFGGIMMVLVKKYVPV